MENVNARDNNLALALYYVFKTVPMLVGAMSIYLGYRLFILGVTGKASLSVNSQEISGQLLNAAPGLFFALFGIAAIMFSVWKGVQITFSPTSMIAGTDSGPNQPNQPTQY